MDLPAPPPPTSPTPPAPPLAVDAELVPVSAPDDEAAGAAPAHGCGDSAVLINDGDGTDAAPAHGGGESAALIDDGDGVDAAPAHGSGESAVLIDDGDGADAAPAHVGGDNVVLIDDGDGAGTGAGGDASPLVADSDHSPLHGENSPVGADGKRKRGRPKKVLPVAEVYGGDETPVAVETGGKRKRGRPRKNPVPPPVSDVDDTDGDDDESPVLAAAADSGGKRKRGRPKKSAGVAAVTKKKGKEEEAVCFVCFDGGDLVICDKRGCTKVYHPACVNRDDAYFRTKGRWNCGWHICSICQKAAQYMCYTCTFSLCRACNRGSNFVCIRGNKGLCETCYGTVMLIESNEHSNGEQHGVELSDQNSWSCLFKIYWSRLKGELSLTLDELSATKNHRKRLGAVAYNDDSSDESYNVNDDEEISSDNSEHHKGNGSSVKKVQRHFRNAVSEESFVKPVDNGETSMADDTKGNSKSFPSAVDEESLVKQVHNGGASTANETKWASRELLELVAHMKDGDTSQLSEYDVQALILAYINNNNLRDPRKKSQIICDPMLKRLFQKERVGHFEMLKLLESHFLMKEASQMIRDNNQGGGQALDSGEMDDEGYNDAAAKFTSDKRRKTRKRVEEREPQINLDDFAAIDVHNIKLMYLRRCLMEDLLGDVDNFSENVIGTFVRIRIPGTGQKKDMYRLVQVIGTHVATAIYKIGKKTTDIRLDVLNLNKTESVTMDTISNQEFTEEECRRLRQCIKCGFISRLTVGQVQEKARVLQALRVNDWLESEKLRLGHLRDRASEKGRRKELRECVEKLQLLNTPEEQHRRLNDVPEIHVDPKMDPAYESVDEGESDDKKQENISKSKEYFSLRKDRLNSIPSRNVNGEGKSSNTNWEVNRSAVPESATGEVDTHSRWGAQANTTAVEAGGWNNNQHAIISEQSHGASLETTLSPVSTVISAPSITSETEKIWQYKDPSQTVHGPFSMTQLRKWNTTGFFPPDLTIWRVSDSQYDCILLTDALNGKFQKDLQPLELQHDSLPQPLKTAPIQNQGNWNAPQTDTAFRASGDNQLGSAYRWPNQTNVWSAPMPNPMDARIWSAPVPNPSNVSTWSSPVQAHNNFIPTAPLCGNNYRPPPHQGRGGRGGNGGRWNRGQDSGSSWNANRPVGQRPSGPAYERRQSNWNSSGQQSSGDVWNTQAANDSKNQWGNNMFNPPTPTPQPTRGGWPASQRTPHNLSPEIKESNKEAASISGGGWSSWSDSTPDNANKANGWGSNSASAILNHTNKADGCNSWSPVSSSVPDQASKTDGWGSNSTSTMLNHTSYAVPGKASKADGWGSNSASTMLNHTDNANGGGSWSPVSSALSDKTNVPEAVNTSPFPGRSDVFSGSDTIGSCIAEVSGTLNKNQFFQGDCPSPTPLCERPEVLAAQYDEIDPASAAPSMGTVNPHPHPCPEMDKGLQPTLTVSENVADGGNVNVTGSGLVPELVKDSKLGSPDASTKPTVESDSAQRAVPNSEGWAPASDRKRGRDVPGLSPLTSEKWDLQQSQKRSDTEDVEWSLPSPTPSTNPSAGWDHLAPQNSGKVSSDKETGWAEWGEPPAGARASSNPKSGWGVPPRSSNINAGTAHSVPRSGDASTCLGAPSQGSTISASGWGAPVVGNAANPGWRAPEHSSNQNANWGAAPTSQGNGGWENNSGWGSRGSSGTRSGGGGRQSRTPPRMQGQTGICKFYESGHCRKGSSCKYRHV